MRYWMMKSEPTVYSIDDLRRHGFSGWEGVRNYQARNYMRDKMKIGDLALFYHSNATPSGAAGICRICRESYPDNTSWDPESKYYDPKSTINSSRWIMVEVEFVEKFSHLVSIEEMRNTPGLEDMPVLKKGSRLSVSPITKQHFAIIQALGNSKIDEPLNKEKVKQHGKQGKTKRA